MRYSQAGKLKVFKEKTLKITIQLKKLQKEEKYTYGEQVE